jgi:type II secretory pathway predicted ATPase ExeA
MYNDYFGFREQPFSVTPDPRFFYTNPHYQEAYANLVYAIRERRGFVVLTGEIGTGKTTLLRRLMEHLEPNIHVVFFYNAVLRFEDLLDVVCEDLGLAVQGQGHLHKIQALNQFLIEQVAKGGTVVLLLDEAQNLGEEVLENLRLLSNLETSREKLLQIALVGQPELETKLDHPGLHQLKQRIASHYRLSRLGDDEVGPFIQYRLSAVGYTRQALFTPAAVQEIAFYAKGFPRLINILCDNALLMAYATSQKRVSAEIIRQVASDLRLVRPEEEERIGHRADVAQPNPDTAPIRRSHERSRRSRRRSHWHRIVGMRILVPVLALVLAGAGFYVWPYHRSFVERLQERLGAWPHTVPQAKHNLASEGEQAQVASDAAQQPSSDLGTGVPRGEGGAPSATHPSTPNHRIDSAQTPEHGRMAGQSSDMRGEEGRSNAPPSPAAVSEGVTWTQEPMAIPAGSTIVDIAAKAYGAHRLLGLDLIKEVNTHIENLNRVAAGQKLWVPPLTRDTLVRQQPDGSYHLIVGSFRGPPQAEHVAQRARLKGYTAVISPRKLGERLMVYRVELRGLGGLHAVNDAWETAVTERWMTFASHRSGERF